MKSFLDDFGMATVVIPFLFEVFIISVTPQSTDSTGEFENLSDEAEELCYSSFFSELCNTHLELAVEMPAQ